MATRSRIGIENEDGTVTSVYCHWDGYPKGNGLLLQEFYNSPEKARELIDLGSISSLRERPKPDEGEKHSFDAPSDGVTIAYHRDRGENLMKDTHKSAEDYLRGDVEEWGYLWTKEGRWVYVEGYDESRTRKNCSEIN